jgi:hypothetical protein
MPLRPDSIFEFPLFLREAERVLRAGGRCIIVRPGITLGTTLFYRCFHHEPVRMNMDPLIEGTPTPDRNPNASNQAILTLLVGRERARLAKLIPMLSLIKTDWFSLIVYPLSGGFNPGRFYRIESDAICFRSKKLFNLCLGLFLHLGC